MPNKIVKARITAMPKKLTDPIPEVHVELDNGTELKLFDYFPEEISFTPEEFIGLDLIQARELKYKKDLAYLQS